MKKINLLYFLLAFSFFSCEDYLDVDPEMGLTSEEVYSDYYSFRGAVDRAQWYVKDYIWYPHFRTTDYVPGVMSDEMQTLHPQQYTVNSVNAGEWLNWQPSNRCVSDYGFGLTTDDGGDIVQYESGACGLSPYGIRAANYAIANIDLLKTFPDVTTTGYSNDDLRDQLLGQCYFLRAWFYFELIRRMGPLPRMDEVFSTDHNFDSARPTYQQATDWMVEDLDLAISLLPEKWDDANGGRPTSISAKAVKAMALLYASSPNMSLPYGVKSDEDAEDCGYNEDYLFKAVQASVEAIKGAESGNSPYSMYSWNNGDGYEQNWFSKTERYSREAIFARMPKETPGNNANTGRGGWRLAYDAGYLKYQVAPTQNIVDMFETVDGYDVNDPNVGASFDPMNPYENRDPRLRLLIYVNGDQLYEDPSAKNGVFSPYIAEGGGDNGYHYTQLVTKRNLRWTGYELRGKLRWRGCNAVDTRTGYYRTYAFIRFVQLYLDLAESANELYGPTGAIPGAEGTDWATAEACINKVRSRIDGFTPVRSEYVNAGKASFRKRIRNERAIELFLEQHRWHDIRRWRIAEDKLKEIRGEKVTKKVDGTFEYDSFVIDNARTFEDKHYWYPFSTAINDMFSVFEQNPGW